jgi:hypothetical protein
MNTAARLLLPICFYKIKPRCAPCGAERVVLVKNSITHHPVRVKWINCNEHYYPPVCPAI